MGGSVATGLHAAFLLARGRPEGLGLVSDDVHAAGRSFWAMAVCVPIVVALRVLSISPPNPHLPFAHLLASDLLVLAVSWIVYTLFSHRLATALGAQDRWPRFIAAWNWCNVLENLLILLGALPGVLGAPGIISQAAQLFALGWALWIEWYVTRSALRVSILMAVCMVLLDEAFGLVASGVSQAMGGG
jgi:hypothetical protein